MPASRTKKNHFTFGIKVKCRIRAITMTLGEKIKSSWNKLLLLRKQITVKIKSQDYEFNTQVRVPLQASYSFKENLKIQCLSLRPHYEEKPVT
jgi:hypothetical protein